MTGCSWASYPPGAFVTSSPARTFSNSTNQSRYVPPLTWTECSAIASPHSSVLCDQIWLHHPTPADGFAISVSENASVSDVLHRLAESRLHRLFLRDDSGRPVGVCSLKDILQALVG